MWVAARSVSDLKMFPLLQVCALGSSSFSFATVVPFPVPDRPCSVITQPAVAASPSAAMISAAMASGVLPVTVILVIASTVISLGMMPFAIDLSMPSCGRSADEMH